MDDEEAEGASPARLAARLDDLELIVLTLGNRLVEMGTSPRSSDRQNDLQPGQPPSDAEMEELDTWVAWLGERYASAGDWLRPCWRLHGFVVEELRALRSAWLAAYDGTEPSSAPIIWHETAERCRERVRRAISTGPGCTAVSHHDDQPVTGDARWGVPGPDTVAGHIPAEHPPGAPDS